MKDLLWRVYYKESIQTSLLSFQIDKYKTITAIANKMQLIVLFDANMAENLLLQTQIHDKKVKFVQWLVEKNITLAKFNQILI